MAVLTADCMNIHINQTLSRFGECECTQTRQQCGGKNAQVKGQEEDVELKGDFIKRRKAQQESAAKCSIITEIFTSAGCGRCKAKGLLGGPTSK